MKIIEKENDIEIKGAKFSTAERPPQLSSFLNYYNLMIIIGLPASGKSSLVKTLLNGTPQDRLYNNVFHSVYYISPSSTMDLDLPPEKIINLSDEPLEIILQNIIDEEYGIGEEDEPHHALIILDDAVNFINKGSKEAQKIMNKIIMNGRHILGRNSSIMIWIISQKIKSINLTTRSQANSIFFFDSTKQEKEVMRDEFLPLDKKEAEQLYKYIYDKPYNFMYVNLFLPKFKRIFKNFSQLILKDI